MDTAVWGWCGCCKGKCRYRLRTPWIQLYGGGLVGSG